MSYVQAPGLSCLLTASASYGVSPASAQVLNLVLSKVEVTFASPTKAELHLQCGVNEISRCVDGACCHIIPLALCLIHLFGSLSVREYKVCR